MERLQYGRGIIQSFNTWMLIQCDDQIGAMYRSLYSLEYFYKPKINKPLWGTHISICRGENQVNQYMNGFEVEFYYLDRMETNGCHFWLPVICPILDTIRQDVGLGKSLCNYHLSIGNIKNE